MKPVIAALVITIVLSISYGAAQTSVSLPVMVRIPGGSLEMGDHHNFVDPSHPSDEAPIHTVRISSFNMGKTHVTVQLG